MALPMQQKFEVAVNLAQDFDATQKAQGRSNLGLAAVAASGDYDDLTNKPTITQPVNADWNSNSGLSQILNRPNLAVVATTGNYTDLNGRPTIPTVNDGDLKFQLGSATATKVFSANQSGESTIVVPNRTYTVNGSTTTYGAGLPTLEDMQAIYSQADWAQSDNTKVDFIKNKPTIPAAANDGTLTITQGTTTLGTFTANQSGNTTVAIPTPPPVPVQYYHAVNFLSFPITSTTSYSTYQYVYPSALDRTKDYIATFTINLAQPSNETWSLGNADIPFHLHVDTTGSFSVIDTAGIMTNLGGGSLYEASISFTVRIPKTYMVDNENLNFLLYLQPNTLTTSNTVELSYKVYYQEYLS